MRVIGIDEAGYGPLLGPLVVASVSLECATDGYDPQRLWNALGDVSGIADSKTVLTHRDMAAGEESTLAFLPLASLPTTRRALLRDLLVAPPPIDPDGTGRLDSNSSVDCCGHEGERFYAEACLPDEVVLPRWGALPTAERRDDLQDRLESVGVTVASVRAIALCPGRFNRALSGGMSKLLLDWKLFAELLRLDAEELAPSGYAVCGKLGGRGQYGALLMDIGLSAVIEEGRALSAYQVAGFGRVEFIRHAEAAHPPVAMASMIAKLVREHLHDQWHTMLARRVPDLERCSGYRDVVTKCYVERTASCRKRLGIPQECFIRSK